MFNVFPSLDAFLGLPALAPGRSKTKASPRKTKRRAADKRAKLARRRNRKR